MSNQHALIEAMRVHPNATQPEWCVAFGDDIQTTQRARNQAGLVKEVRRRLKWLAQTTTNEVYKVPLSERASTLGYFHSKLKEEIEDRETREQIEKMIDEGCPNVQED